MEILGFNEAKKVAHYKDIVELINARKISPMTAKGKMVIADLKYDWIPSLRGI